ncbi:signal peptide peptidase SppA, 36K type [Isosphaera pallida ATCC 43644]|uniref:Signal peptide peptidase SppA, 36K type n=1 Tax=Isosphaera pallida (strain ATCC 43644 / DSM 9630 / IS1B) TaxID=575540 RepID=E8R496_ISOPI|nr:S49 family peptidase [Isosphaera pallida]ADV62697.1 signal peptide peptidase SppA, 36K type [Isosphaera pallida ATCC 43644]
MDVRQPRERCGDAGQRARHGVVVLAGVLAWCGGCAKPLDIRTQNRFDVAGSVETRVTAELSAVSQGGPVVAVAVEPGVPVECAKVALIDLDGLIANAPMAGFFSLGDNPVATVSEKLAAAARDPTIMAVVVRINSPGGGVAATDALWREVQSFRSRTRKPTVAAIIDVGAGGGYYLAAGCDRIVAAPGAIIGGIGVVLNLYNVKDLMAQFNVFSQSIKAGDKIDLGSSVEPLDDESRQLLQEMADEYHERFKQVVRRGRPGLTPQAEPLAFDGRIMSARRALELGLIDEIGHLEDALATARTLAGVPDAVPVLFRRRGDAAYSLYAVTPNTPIQNQLLPFSIPGVERAKLPGFLYLWQAEPTLERASGR